MTNSNSSKKNRRMYAMGHVDTSQGCGVHRDKRSKRRRTRQAQKVAAIKDYS